MTMAIDDVILTCINSECGISFAVPQWWYKGKKETKTTFHCPNGHRQHFTGETEEEKMRRERDIARQQVARAEQEAEEQRLRAVRAEKSERKLKKRAAAGTCPCCQRTFSNMSTHMKKQHPDYVKDAANVVPIKAKG
jgi:hypothetical protein